MLQDHFKSNLARIFDMLAEARAPARESGRHAGAAVGRTRSERRFAARPADLLHGPRGAVAPGPRNMEKFVKLTGVAAPLPIINVDTDMIIPKQYLKTIKRTGLGKGLFSEMRYQRRRLGKPGFRPQQAGLSQGADPRRRRQFRLRLVPRARALGAARFRHPLRHLDELRRHFLQQLLQERHPADHGLARPTSTS